MAFLAAIRSQSATPGLASKVADNTFGVLKMMKRSTALAAYLGMTMMAEAAATKKEATAVETVKMDDERLVEFAGKRKLLKESIIEADGTVKVRLDFRSGETRTFTIPPAMLNKFAAHGAEQKLGDEIAGIDDIDDAVLAVDELMGRLNQGEWGVKRDGSGMAGTSVLMRALVEMTGKTPEQIKAFLTGKSQAEKVALRSNPKVKPIVERLEAEKAAKGNAKVDTDALLGELAA